MIGSRLSVLDEAGRREIFGDFGHKEIGSGRVQVDADWVRDNIVSCRLARANGEGDDVVTCCHREVKEPLEAAFAQVAHLGLWRLIHSFDGLWVPRHKAWNPRLALSSHSWGVAFDLNASINPYGSGASIENHVLNAVFHHYGFTWRGDWLDAPNAVPNGMHWEVADLKTVKQDQASTTVPRLIIALRHGPSFSYHTVPGAQMARETFWLEATSLRSLLGLPPLNTNGQSSSKALRKRASLHNALNRAELKVLKYSDRSDDARDPRYYAFVEPLISRQ